MTQEFVIQFGMESIKTTLLLAAPMLGFGLVTGLLVSIFQAVTSIQELTLTFYSKNPCCFFIFDLVFPMVISGYLGLHLKYPHELPCIYKMKWIYSI